MSPTPIAILCVLSVVVILDCTVCYICHLLYCWQNIGLHVIRFAVSPVKIAPWSSCSSILLHQYSLTSTCLTTVTLAMTWQTRSWCKGIASLLSQQCAEVSPHLMVVSSQLLSQSLLVASMEYWAARRGWNWPRQVAALPIPFDSKKVGNSEVW